MEPQDVSDRHVIAMQLGREPQGRWSVACRCPYGYPQVIRVAPIVAGRPFPTLYWLTCPFLRAAISRLEADGWVKRLEARMRTTTELAAAMDNAHDRYWQERNGLLSGAQRERLAPEFEGRGIGGIADRRYLKCLHLHAAHALAGENPIGKIVLERLAEQFCDRKEVICSAYV